MTKVRELTEKEKVREKISVWLGSSTNHIHVIKELIGNSQDEILKNNGNEIKITMYDDKTIEFYDNCKGLPVEGSTDKGTPNHVALFETLFAGTKYDKDSYTVGTNGVFLAVLTFSSARIDYEIARPNGKVYAIAYEKGELVEDFRIIGKSDKTYTKIKFTLDNTVYDRVDFDFDNICKIAQGQAALTNSFITTEYKQTGEIETYHYQDSIREYLTELLGESKTVSEQITIKKKLTLDVVKKGEYSKEEIAEKLNITQDSIDLDLVFQYTTSDDIQIQKEFLNGSELLYHGTIQEGIVAGLKNAFHKQIRKLNLYKKKEKGINNDDVLVGLKYIVNFKSLLAEFENQTKLATRVPHYKTVLQNVIEEFLETYFIENPIECEKILKQVLLNKNIREKSEQTRANIKKKLQSAITVTSKVEGLVDCKLKDNTKTELYIAEGQSALGSLIMSRNALFQACMPIRGKIMNCLKSDLDKIFKSEIITNLIRVLGCGIEVKSKQNKDLDTFNIDNLKWNKIIISTDQDEDGLQIRTLILTMIYRLIPTLLKEGKVFIAESPLFEIEANGQHYYTYSVQEKEDILSKLGNTKYKINRNKGLGETTAEVMSETMMNPDSRRITQVTMEDVESAIKHFELFLGEDIATRKEYIQAHFEESNNDIQEVLPVKDVDRVLTENYMPYANYVIKERAIVSIDGFKPVHKRLLHSMYTNKNTADKNRTKSANITGATMQYHPHGDSAIYEAMVRLAQTDSLLYPLIDGKGNFGQHTSKSLQYASARYTEARLAPIVEEMFKDINKGVVPMVNNYDGTKKEPSLLPTKFPNILTSPNMGIAVGMSSNICSFNLKEVCETTRRYIYDKNIDLRETLLAPDFATGGDIIYDKNKLNEIYNKGTGSFKIRAKYRYNEKENTIEVYEIPYSTTREDIINKIIELIKDDTIKEISDIRDLTDLKGLCILIELKKNVDYKLLMTKLYKLTPLESSFSCNFNILIDGIPKVMGIKEILDNWIDFRLSCIKKSLTYDKEKCQAELHKLIGLQKILLDIDRVIKIIRMSATDEEVMTNLKTFFNLDDTQASTIANMKLRNINSSYISAKTDEIAKVDKQIKDLDILLNSKEQLLDIIIKDLKEIESKYGADRKSTIAYNVENITNLQDLLIEEYNTTLFLTKDGYLKKVPNTSLRGGSTHKLKDGDSIIQTIDSTNKSDIIVLTNLGVAYKIKAHTLKDNKNSEYGVFLPGYLNLSSQETILSVVSTLDYKEQLLIAYENGKIAKIPMSSYATKTNRTKLLSALNLEYKVVNILLLDSEHDIICKSSIDKVIIINTEKINAKASKNTKGIQVMQSKNNSTLVFCELLNKIDGITTPEYYLGGKIGKYLKKEDKIILVNK